MRAGREAHQHARALDGSSSSSIPAQLDGRLGCDHEVDVNALQAGFVEFAAKCTWTWGGKRADGVDDDCARDGIDGGDAPRTWSGP